MKKLLALVTAVAFVLLPSLVAAKKAPPQTIGTISVWNEAAKEFIVKDAEGKDQIFGWNEKTKVMGSAKVGERAKVLYKEDKHGKKWATELHVGAAADAPPPPKKK